MPVVLPSMGSAFLSPGALWILESTYSSFGGCCASFPEVAPKAAYFEWWPEEEKA